MPGKSQGQIQHVKLITETNDMISDKLEAEINYISSKYREGWVLNRSQQARSLETGEFLQLISASDCRPIKVFRNEDGDRVVSVGQINRECQADARTVVDGEDGGRDSGMLTIMIISSVVLLVFLVVIWKVIG